MTHETTSITSANLAQLQSARTAALQGMSPTQRGEQKMLQALEWVYRWGWASASTIDQLAGIKRRGLAKRLVNQGLLHSTKTLSGGAFLGIPAYILTLTPVGLARVEQSRELLLPYQLDPYRYRQKQLRHDEIAQRKTLEAFNNKRIRTFKTEKECAAEGSKFGVKQPDAIWHFNDGLVAGIEIELSAKWSRVLDQFIAACLFALETSNDKPAPLDMVLIITDSPAIRDRYKKAFDPGTEYGIWEKHGSLWKRTGKASIPSSSDGSILCSLFKD